jgi:hypothetical protein
VVKCGGLENRSPEREAQVQILYPPPSFAEASCGGLEPA